MATTLQADGEIFALPRVVFVGPWSTGKTSMINYLLGIENTSFALTSGAEPTTTDFVALMYGDAPKKVEGMVLAIDGSFHPLEKFGQSFLERFLGIQIPNKLLQQVNFVDTPGIIENRKQQMRGYPFAEVCQWFIDRADLVFAVFDPTKLDVGAEVESLFKHLKGREAKVRIILNKADTVSPQELMRVYGALFWSLAPLINITEPPKVYVGSFWSKNYQSIARTNGELFLDEETTLLQDLFKIIANRLENKVAFVRQHAALVRNHALVVDQFLDVLQSKKSIFKDTRRVAAEVAENADSYKIFQTVLGRADISRHDLLPRKSYAEFFSVHPMDSFYPLARYCNFWGSCLIDAIETAMQEDLPVLLEEIKRQKIQRCHHDGHCQSASSGIRQQSNQQPQHRSEL